MSLLGPDTLITSRVLAAMAGRVEAPLGQFGTVSNTLEQPWRTRHGNVGAITGQTLKRLRQGGIPVSSSPVVQGLSAGEYGAGTVQRQNANYFRMDGRVIPVPDMNLQELLMYTGEANRSIWAHLTQVVETGMLRDPEDGSALPVPSLAGGGMVVPPTGGSRGGGGVGADMPAASMLPITTMFRLVAPFMGIQAYHRGITRARMLGLISDSVQAHLVMLSQGKTGPQRRPLMRRDGVPTTQWDTKDEHMLETLMSAALHRQGTMRVTDLMQDDAFRGDIKVMLTMRARYDWWRSMGGLAASDDPLHPVDPDVTNTDAAYASHKSGLGGRRQRGWLANSMTPGGAALGGQPFQMTPAVRAEPVPRNQVSMVRSLNSGTGL